MNAALDEIRDEGPEHASLRSIARRTGISHQAVAYHFSDRTALFTEVAASGWDELCAACRRAASELPRGAPAGAAVAAMGAAYVDFARSDPERFRLMFGSRSIDPSSGDLREKRRSLWRLYVDAVQQAVSEGWGGGTEAEVLAVATWSAAHGLATLERDLPAGLPFALTPEQVIQLVAADTIRA